MRDFTQYNSASVALAALLVACSGLCGLFCTSCSSSKSEQAERAEGTGSISGKVEQVLHHGAYNPDGPNQTITPLAGIELVLSDSTGTVIDTLRSDSTGTFYGRFTPGVYTLTAPEQSHKSVPGSSPPPERVQLNRGETAVVLFQYQIYAP